MSSSLNVLSRYLDALAAPHILCDRDYRIRFANRAYRERFAYGAEIVGQPCFAVSHHYRQPCNDCGESCPLQRSLQSLVSCCRGDDRPDCPILDDLAAPELAPPH